MLTIHTSIQHSAINSNETRQEKGKRHPIGNEEIKLIVFAYDMNLYVENPNKARHT
jgi:hypothetical protein